MNHQRISLLRRLAARFRSEKSGNLSAPNTRLHEKWEQHFPRRSAPTSILHYSHAD